MVAGRSKEEGVKKVDTHPWKEDEEKEKEDKDLGLPYQNRKNYQSWSSVAFPPNHPLHHQRMVVLVVSVEVVLTEIPCLRMRRRVHATFCECYGILPFCSWDMSPVEV